MNPAPNGDGGKTGWADAHNHLYDSRLAGCADGLPPCIVNATHEGDWTDVLATAASAPDRHAALGIHPWFAAAAEPGWEDRLRELLEKHPAATIGECGLDAKTRACAPETQAPVFETQIRLARELDRSLSIHCVGAWGRLMETLKREPPPARWLMHSFNGSAEIARQLAGMGAYFSINGRALHRSGEKILRTFRTLPPERILLETDAPNQPPPGSLISHPLPDGLNHPANLAAIGAALAPLLGFGVEEFAVQTRHNLECFLAMRL